jgi:Family of unknown function (DUF6868)
MNVETIIVVLGWTTLINIALLAWWVLFVVLAHDWTYQLHAKWFKFSRERFDAIHYSLMGFFKMGIILFNLVPYLSLRIAV